MPLANTLDKVQKRSEMYKKTKLWGKRNEPSQEKGTFADVDKRHASEYVHRYLRPRMKNLFALNQEEKDNSKK